VLVDVAVAVVVVVLDVLVDVEDHRQV